MAARGPASEAAGLGAHWWRRFQARTAQASGARSHGAPGSGGAARAGGTAGTAGAAARLPPELAAHARVLGLTPESLPASARSGEAAEAVKAAFRRAAKATHPDLAAPAGDPRAVAAAAERFRSVQAAYAALSVHYGLAAGAAGA